MSFVVISCFDSAGSGNLQADGEAVAVVASEALARKRFADRCTALAGAATHLIEGDATANLITWVVLLQMPLEVADVEQALEDLETVVEETECVDDPFGELVLDYVGHRRSADGNVDYPQMDALRGLQAWLT